MNLGIVDHKNVVTFWLIYREKILNEVTTNVVRSALALFRKSTNMGEPFSGIPVFLIRHCQIGFYITNKLFWLSENCALTSGNIKKGKFWEKLIF